MFDLDCHAVACRSDHTPFDNQPQGNDCIEQCRPGDRHLDRSSDGRGFVGLELNAAAAEVNREAGTRVQDALRVDHLPAHIEHDLVAAGGLGDRRSRYAGGKDRPMCFGD